MATVKYNRSEILNFFDLTEKQREDVVSCYYQDESEAENDTFVIFEAKKPEYNAAIPLSQFMRLDRPSIFDGVFGTSYFSAYFIKLSKCGTMAVVCEKCI